MRANNYQCRLAKLNAPGFTLMELLVVLGVLGVLTALLLPAVQRAREASWQIRCQANLHQLGVALHAYESTFAFFPSGSGGALKFVPTGGSPRFYSPLTRLLPYLDHRSLYDGVNFAVAALDPEPGWGGSENTTVFRRNIELFLCPADPWAPGGQGGKNSFRFNAGTGPQPLPPTNNGAFPPGTWTRSTDFADGLSFTAGVAEKIKGDGNPRRFHAAGDAWLTGPPGARPTNEQLAILCAAVATPVPLHYSNTGGSWLHAGFGWTWYNHGLTPNHPIPDCTVDKINAGAISGLFTARSMHPGGVNVMMMDGSVRFVSDSIDLSTWRALATRADGEQLDSNF
jgi:prepilin-type N-terminal cleavage/methylation domain-containing protein/prepilin-type processing-associated H-X9-DG protein